MELTLIFQIISTSSIIIGIIFGILNLRNFQAMRKREAAILMLNSFQTSDFVRGLLLVINMQDNTEKDEIDNLPREDNFAFYILLGTWERLGILVHRREIPFDLVIDAFSGPIMTSWAKLGKFISDFRQSAGRDTGFEWFQWLAERVFESEEKSSALPAYLTQKNWKP